MIFISLSEYDTNEQLYINVSHIVAIEESGYPNSCVIQTMKDQYHVSVTAKAIIKSLNEIDEVIAFKEN